MQDDLPKGFKAGAAAAGFKAQNRDDLGLIVSDRPAALAGSGLKEEDFQL